MDMAEEFFLWLSSYKFDGLVDDCLRDAHHVVFDSELRKFTDLNHIRLDERVFHGELVGDTYRSGAVGAGRGDEDLEVYGCFESGQSVLGFR